MKKLWDVCPGCPEVAASCQGHSWCQGKIPSKARVSLLPYTPELCIVGTKPQATVVKTRRGGENVGRDSEGSKNRGGEWNHKDNSQHSRAELCDLNMCRPPPVPQVPARAFKGAFFSLWTLTTGH